MSTSVARLRERYLPDRIRILFLAESPPDSTEDEVRFFYNPRQERYDHMYRSVMKAVFPAFEYTKGEKDIWLRRFQEAGCYMIDATDTPINRLSAAERRKELGRNLKVKTEQIKKLASRKTAVVLVKKNIFELFHKPLREAGCNVIHESFLPFPSHGNQGRFIAACGKCVRPFLAAQRT